MRILISISVAVATLGFSAGCHHDHMSAAQTRAETPIVLGAPQGDALGQRLVQPGADTAVAVSNPSEEAIPAD